MQHATTIRNGISIVDVGAEELRRVTFEDEARRETENRFNEARGREAARLAVQLKALAELDERAAANARAHLEAIERLAADLADRASKLSHLVESFEQVAAKRFDGVQDDLRARADALAAEIREAAGAERARDEALTRQVRAFESALAGQVGETQNILSRQLGDAQGALTRQVGEARETLASQTSASTERLSQDVRALRDELVRLIDSRMNHADAAFAAVRGDVEVVKFLVMDIIKDRIGRADPKAKPF